MSGRMRILHVVDSLRPGGMENGVVNMAHQLAGTHEVAVACLRRGGAFETRLPSSCEVFGLGKGQGFTPGAVWRLAKLIRRWKPDVLHTHNLGTLIYGIASRLAGGGGVPICHGEHGALRPFEMTTKRKLQRRFLYSRCSLIHGVSRELADNLEKEWGLSGPGGVRTVLNGVDCAKFRPAGDGLRAAWDRLGLGPREEEAMVIGVVARVAPTKRHPFLVDAMERLRQRPGVPPIHLLIVGGEGGAGDALKERLAGSPVADHVHWVGFQDATLTYYQAMDLLAIVSEKEGLSNAMLEAMACGVPVFSHTACGGAEVLEDGVTGFVREVTGGGSLADGLDPVLRDRAALGAMGSKARARVQERFSLQAMADNYRALYREAAAGRRF